MEQYNVSLDDAPPLSKGDAKTVYDWLELSDQQKTKKAKELDPFDVDVLMQLLL